jgi:predicted transcriptional regulator of viral defense system
MVFRGENMIKTTTMLLDDLKTYASPANKLARMVANGDIIQIVKGLYETDPTVPGHLLAGSIYGPSYISFEYALSYHNLIPEAVYTITCASFEKKKKKKYETPFGTFTYRDIPSEAFPLGLEVIQEGDYYYRIATAEKALCDKLYTMSPVANLAELHILLADNLRIDEAELRKLNRDVIASYCESYHTTNIKKLKTLLGRI